MDYIHCNYFDNCLFLLFPLSFDTVPVTSHIVHCLQIALYIDLKDVVFHVVQFDQIEDELGASVFYVCVEILPNTFHYLS